MPRGRHLGALVGALVAAFLVGAPTAIADHPSVPIHSPAPAPGSVVESGTTTLSAWVRGFEANQATWEVDGSAVPGATVGPEQPGWGRQVTATVALAAGTHLVSLSVGDGETTLEREWRFTSTDRRVTRLSGKGRVETSVAISRARFGDGEATEAVLARADDFADALAGAPLAFHRGGPLLLSTSDELHPAARDELRRVLPAGARVHLLGGQRSLTPAVRDELVGLGYQVVRHAGANRYATAAAIARQMPAADAVMVASGESFPDALAVSVPAARDGVPVLLTRRDDLPTEARDFLAGRGIAGAFVIGGAGTVSVQVAEAVDDHVGDVERVAGATRFATAVAVAERFFGEVSSFSLASGVSFPDALTGTGDAADRGHPLLLTDTDLPPATDAHLRATRPMLLTVYGGPSTVGNHVVAAAVRAAEDGVGAPALSAAVPSAATVPYLDAVTLRLTEPVAGGTSVHVEVGGREVVGQMALEGDTVTFIPSDHEPFHALDVAHAARVVLSAVDTDGRVGRHEVAFTYLVPDPLFATVGGVDLYLPSRDVEMIGFHQSNHDGARQLAPFDTATPMQTLPSRGRGTGSRTAADIVASPDQPITAPVTGTVKRAGTYRLYCDYYDHYLVVEPDAHPGWEVKLLHFVGLQVSTGDRVVARQTVVGTGPRTLPFESQVDEYSHPRNWPHVHLEVVDPSIPDRPGSGC